jgi:exonuclease III
MLLLSLNIRGIGGTLKAASIQRCLALTRPEIIFFQENLVSTQKSRDFLLSINPTWVVCSVSSVGTSGGLLAAWDPYLFELVPSLTVGGILLSGKSLTLQRNITLLNIYAPCNNQTPFWNTLDDSGILTLNNLIIAGDFNLLLSPEEAWGGNQTDTVDGYFSNLFSTNHLIDIKPTKLLPTWRNGRQGHEAISRRLDRCLVADSLLSEVGYYRSWVEMPFVSDHAPVLLQLDLLIANKVYPFKFSEQWLCSKDYTVIVEKVWRDPLYLSESGKQKRVIWKLQGLKVATKLWNKALQTQNKAKLSLIEDEIKSYSDILSHDYNEIKTKDILRCLELERNELLRSEEEHWRLRSRALWLAGGDRNTKYFHKIASHNRVKKHIWEIVRDDGVKVVDQQGIKEEAV